MNNFIYHLLICWLVIAGFMLLLWAIQIKTGNAAIADVGWAYGIAFGILYFSFIGDGNNQRIIITAAMGIIWGLRLGTYLLINRVVNAQEDSRYKNFRKSAEKNILIYFFLFFQAQAFVAVLFVIPIVIVFYNHQPLNYFDISALFIWLFSMGGECVADKQLSSFKAKKSNIGKVCRNGLWRYSRHPNYFFEWIHWWSYVLLNISSNNLWISLTGPLLMLFFLVKVSGIPFAEQQALNSKGIEYEKYIKITNMFFPGPPKDKFNG
jgi:steroid 5-alpha reductase family enzyme